MRHFRGLPASLRVSTLLISCAVMVPAGVRAGSIDRDQPRILAGAEPSADITLPEVPPASVTISPMDLMPGEGTHAALSRLVAHPGVILKPAAPLRPRNAGETAPSSAPLAPPAPAPAMAAHQPGLVPLAVVAGAESPRATDSAGIAPAGATIATVQPEASPAPLPVAPTEPGPAAPPPPATVAPAEPAPLASVPPTPSTLDRDTLAQALHAYVEGDAKGAAGPLTAREDARRMAREAVAAFYAARADTPLWIENGQLNARARSVLARIDHAAEDGLDLVRFPVSVPRGGDAATLATAELSLTEAAVAYGRQASGGRINPAHLSALIAAKPDVADAAHILGSLAKAADAGEALRDFNPPQKGYALLRTKLGELRQKSETVGHGTIPYGPILKPGMKDARVPLIRARFGLDLPSNEADASGLVYDTRVAAAIADFQRNHGMPASGVLTIRTIAALSGGNPIRLENEIVANMERWRWLPRDLGETYIEVNIPDFTLDVMRGETVVHHARVVVGKPDKATPVFSEAMKFIIVNPYWNVPLSIVKKEMMPKLAADPDYFTNHGYETVERDGITYVRQPPGETNALGRIKFMFPNKFSVYLHDTNARSLFGNDMRAMSHGCVRVDQPFKLAETVLGRENGWSEARVKRLIGGDERTINLPRPIAVHIVYFTAFVDANGALRLRDDVYGYSAKVKAALGLEG